MPDAFPTETHPADDLDLDDVGSDFAFGRPCDIPPGVVGDATHAVFTVHWPALLRTVRAYRARVDELLAAVARRDARITRLQLALAAARREAACFRAAHRDRQGLPSDPGHAVCRMADDGFERAVLERWHAASGADCPVYGCDGERIELEVVGKPSFVRLTCGHDEPTPEKPPHSPVDAPADPGTPAPPLAPA